jgi:ferrochelatase
VFVTSAYSSYSGCRQYREDIMRALAALEIDDMRFDKIRVFFNHPGFIDPMAARLRDVLSSLPDNRRERTEVIFTAHSVPLSMARCSAYERQLHEASRLVAERADAPRFRLAWQSRSGPPHIPWLEPDILDVIDELNDAHVSDIVIVPIGFISDHLEVLFDLDVEARERAIDHGMAMIRVPSVGADPRFISMIRELVEERLTANPVRRALGLLGPNHDVCPLNCCRDGAHLSLADQEIVRATA